MTADSLAAPRAPHSAPRNRGVNLEKWGWLYMRASGVLLIVLIFGHLFVNLMVEEGGVHAIDFAFVAGKLASPFWQWWDVLMLWLAFIHGANGMRTIVNDYVRGETARKALVATIWIAAGVMIVLGTLVVFTFDPCAGVTGVFEHNTDSVLYEVCHG
ncbi:succinate dehydrogenase hydrophobic membrane anchor subunit [Microbacterium album]|uniref:Succinate dehydrogenase n=1 Tax=Microbacterium album TaxID=2053191 RepID=A0A917MKJ5_9MICO|nr:succinate dehydrogenase hydrophobic membrane anchor subunit [Microbacterium album]GGH37161.1 succinate dehydrogenase [Microbacterium album]